MAPPVAILMETRVLAALPERPHLLLAVEVLRRDGWYAYRAYDGGPASASRPQFEVTSGTVWFARADSAARAGESHLRECLEQQKPK